MRQVTKCGLAALMTMILAAGTCAATRGEIKMGKTRLVYSVPDRADAYSEIPIDYKLEGMGNVVVEVEAYPKIEAAKYYSHKLPRRVRLQVKFVSQDEKRGRFEIANKGDSIWRLRTSAEPGSTSDIIRDTMPGETLERVIPRGERYAFDFGEPPMALEFRADEVGQSKSAEVTRDSLTQRYPRFTQFMLGYAAHELKGHASGIVHLQVPPWETKVIVRLITSDGMRGAAVPIKINLAYLKLKPGGNQRWALNGKPTVLLHYLAYNGDPVNIRADLERFRGLIGDYVLWLALSTPEQYPGGRAFATARVAREMGLKFMPDISYVRQAWMWNAWRPQSKYMKAIPNPTDGDDRSRIDALDQVFPGDVADYVDMFFREYGDALYRTSDGKVPMVLCSEASYGYMYARPFPTRWGGQTKEDVAAFREWLRQKYQGSIDQLNLVWKTKYGDFSEIDPSPICRITPNDYPDPWKEWSPALEDFDLFRTWLWSQFYTRIGVAIHRLHPDVLLGINPGYSDMESEAESTYGGIEEWGVGINWSARRTATMLDGLLWADFLAYWNTGTENGMRKVCRFWRTWDKDVVQTPRDGYYRGSIGKPGNLSRFEAKGVEGQTISDVEMAMYPIWKAAWEEGGVVSMPRSKELSVMNEWHEREAALFAREARTRQ